MQERDYLLFNLWLMYIVYSWTIWEGSGGLINPGFLLSMRPKSNNPPVLPRAPRGSRWHSSHFLDNSHNAVGGYSNKGGTALGHKTLKAANGRDSSGCSTIHEFARIETNKGCRERADGAQPAYVHIASDLSRGMQECAIITQRCGSTVRAGFVLDMRFLSSVFHTTWRGRFY